MDKELRDVEEVNCFFKLTKDALSRRLAVKRNEREIQR